MTDYGIENSSPEPAMNRGEIYYYLRSRNPKDHDELLSRVAARREEAGSNRVVGAGLITLSNICIRDCIYCGFRAGGPQGEKFRLAEKQISLAAETASAAGIKWLILKSGDDPELPPDQVAKLVRELSDKFGFTITLALGERDPSVYALWREAGASSYWLRHETCDPHLYRRIRPSMYWVDRVRSMEAIKQSGRALGTGIMLGMPNQSYESLVDDVLIFIDPGIFAIVIEPFLPPPNSPGFELIQKPENLIVIPDQATMEKVVAVTRILRPDVKIPVTSAHVKVYNALESVSLFKAGVDSIIFDFTSPQSPDIKDTTPLSGYRGHNDIPRIKAKLKEMGLDMVFDPPAPTQT